MTVDGRTWTLTGEHERAAHTFSDDGRTQEISWEVEALENGSRCAIGPPTASTNSPRDLLVDWHMSGRGWSTGHRTVGAADAGLLRRGRAKREYARPQQLGGVRVELVGA